MRCSVEVGEDRRGSHVEGLNVFSLDVFYRKSLFVGFLQCQWSVLVGPLCGAVGVVVGSCGVPIMEVEEAEEEEEDGEKEEEEKGGRGGWRGWLYKPRDLRTICLASL